MACLGCWYFGLTSDELVKKDKWFIYISNIIRLDILSPHVDIAVNMFQIHVCFFHKNALQKKGRMIL